MDGMSPLLKKYTTVKLVIAFMTEKSVKISAIIFLKKKI